MKNRVIHTVILVLGVMSLPACQKEEEHKVEEQKVVVTTPMLTNVSITQPYVAQIHARRYIEVRALQEGYLEPIQLKEGQSVKEGDVMFRILPILYKTRLDVEQAELQFAEVEYANTTRLRKTNVVSDNEVLLYAAKLAKAKAKVAQSQAELNFTLVKAPFDGIIDRLFQQQGSLVKKDDILTTLSDNSTMWVYFNVPEARYFEYKEAESLVGASNQDASGNKQQISKLTLVNSTIELKLANGKSFPFSAGNTVTIEGKFDNKTGNIPFRADFPNPEGLLRHGQTGTILVHRAINNVLVIPQRATFEVLDKRYVFVVDNKHIVHQRLITIEHELDDTFVIKTGLDLSDKIILEGVRQVRDEQELEDYDFRKPETALNHQKFHAE